MNTPKTNPQTVYSPAEIAFMRTSSVINVKRISYGQTKTNVWFKRIQTKDSKTDKIIPEAQVPDSILRERDEQITLVPVIGMSF